MIACGHSVGLDVFLGLARGVNKEKKERTMEEKPRRRKPSDKKRREYAEASISSGRNLGEQLSNGISTEQLNEVPSGHEKTSSRVEDLVAYQHDPSYKRPVIENPGNSILPPRWERLLSHDFTTEEWATISKPIEDVAIKEDIRPDTLLALDQTFVKLNFYSKCYGDEDTERLVANAYKRGAERMKAHLDSSGIDSVGSQYRRAIEIHRSFIEFLLEDHKEKVNPVISLTPAQLIERVVQYFVRCDLEKRFYTVPGLAFYIGFCSRDEMFEYLNSDSNSANVYVIKRAMMHIEAERVVDMLYGGGMMAGHKLDLATNFNYNDAGKKGNDQPAPTNITVNNNTLSLAGSPPKPESVEEWQSWYEKNERAKLEAAKEPKDIDVSPV